MKRYRPGEKAPQTGYFSAIDHNGENNGEIYLEKGQHFPKTKYEGSFYFISEQ